ncbi:MAG: hypothetical protein Ct9H300mP8_12170 [Gammaproteobacteria bacterium]|nr:MAG: hypothetical protein Ct9H300mP8_12170 [Gammaproteobacteria bacterium]
MEPHVFRIGAETKSHAGRHAQHSVHPVRHLRACPCRQAPGGDTRFSLIEIERSNNIDCVIDHVLYLNAIQWRWRPIVGVTCDGALSIKVAIFTTFPLAGSQSKPAVAPSLLDRDNDST